jgi:hypothetical protein
LYNEELDNWYSSPNINRQIKSSRMRWAGHVARIGEERKGFGGRESPKEGDHSEDRIVDGMGSEWILGRLAGVVEWIQLAQDMDQWRVLVNIAMDLRVLAPWR